ncbi:hypothetical protein A2291_08095 [candidate division WOR-1 bacterium RIFOXYB2_FULL_42_35]|uniref:Uncharacterized protein n=1 Tax=candidate division WOR-1 bacterium RIFOXYC2_FULL_41_25 TaxID=1802586 RepID=A0A1F4TIB5_UNCSA|nr:MAG: hypothetical protein A2247_01945 [candidate division WOR-1 bacterium RIFOXYA2_FULL_41_14]OGC24048.1 MAG: hypothetical protein A2291_08095 [candidate division WOR-1 bacterium RIFOXYB2_FULL_42_35]OGC32471.1 MAG: hypothetical protein A2462_00195 [candidate division WOR-1 bacterium RIFOXYC2_FULL_41_25]
MTYIGDTGNVKFALPMDASNKVLADTLGYLDSVFELNQEATIDYEVLEAAGKANYKFVAEKDPNSPATGPQKYLVKAYVYRNGNWETPQKNIRQILLSGQDLSVSGKPQGPSYLFAVLRQLSSLDLKDKGPIRINLTSLVRDVKSQTESDRKGIRQLRKVDSAVITAEVNIARVGQHSQTIQSYDLDTYINFYNDSRYVDNKPQIITALEATLAQAKRTKLGGSSLNTSIDKAEKLIAAHKKAIQDKKEVATELDPVSTSFLINYTREEIDFLLKAGWEDDGDGVAEVHEFENQVFAKSLDRGTGAHKADGIISGSLSGDNNIAEAKASMTAWGNIVHKGRQGQARFDAALADYRRMTSVAQHTFSNGQFTELATVHDSITTLAEKADFKTKADVEAFAEQHFHSPAVKAAAVKAWESNDGKLTGWQYANAALLDSKVIDGWRLGSEKLEALLRSHSKVDNLLPEMLAAEEASRTKPAISTYDSSSKYGLQKDIRELKQALVHIDTNPKEFFDTYTALLNSRSYNLADSPDVLRIVHEAHYRAGNYRLALLVAVKLDNPNTTDKAQAKDGNVAAVFKAMKDAGVYWQTAELIRDKTIDIPNRDVYAKQLIDDCLSDGRPHMIELAKEMLAYLPDDDFVAEANGTDSQKKAWGRVRIDDYKALVRRRTAIPDAVRTALRGAFTFNTTTLQDGRTVGGWVLKNVANQNQEAALTAAVDTLRKIANNQGGNYSRETRIYANFALARCLYERGDIRAKETGNYDDQKEAAVRLRETFLALKYARTANPPIDIPPDIARHMQKKALHMFAAMVTPLVSNYLSNTQGGSFTSGTFPKNYSFYKDVALALLKQLPIVPMHSQGQGSPTVPNMDPETGHPLPQIIKDNFTVTTFRHFYSVMKVQPSKIFPLNADSRERLEGLGLMERKTEDHGSPRTPKQRVEDRKNNYEKRLKSFPPVYNDKTSGPGKQLEGIIEMIRAGKSVKEIQPKLDELGREIKKLEQQRTAAGGSPPPSVNLTPIQARIQLRNLMALARTRKKDGLPDIRAKTKTAEAAVEASTYNPSYAKAALDALAVALVEKKT